MNKDVIIKTMDGKSYDIPVEGSLGLLALGYVGIMMWREKIRASQSTSPPLTENEPTS